MLFHGYLTFWFLVDIRLREMQSRRSDQQQALGSAHPVNREPARTRELEVTNDLNFCPLMSIAFRLAVFLAIVEE